MNEILQWLISCQAMLMLWLMGNKSKWGPKVGMAGQILWFYYAFSTKQYGLLAGIVMFTVVHCRNLMKWQHE